MQDKTDSQMDIARTLGKDPSSDHSGRLKRWLVMGLIVLALAAGILAWWINVEDGRSPGYKTREVKSGNLLITVTATGTLQPVNQVDVGSEISGTVETVEVDFNDRVKEGQILARLDTSKLEAQAMKSKAALQSAQSRVLQGRATVKEARDSLARLKKVRELSDGKVPSKHELDAAEAALIRAEADVASAEAQVSEARATLDANETDISKAVIRSPINGIVLVRSVEPGQTVAASFQAPVLFTLAEDLAKMELHVDVDEADVGMVKEEQEASFTVDAYPARSFQARITQVRFGSQTVEGVVTYETVMIVDNSDLSLRPGMTATADIIVNKVEKAILVPNAALRFSPPKEDEGSEEVGLLNKLIRRWPRRTPQRRNAEQAEGYTGQQVWVLHGKNPTMVPVKVGSTDGRMSEIIEGDIRPGQQVIVDVARSNR